MINMRSDNFGEARRLIEQTLAARMDHERQIVRRMGDFLERAKVVDATVRQSRRQTAQRFNIFETLGMSDDELLHSRFLAFLLDPDARHDQGALFLRSFLSRFRLVTDLTRVCDESPSITVHTEFPVAEGRLDVIVFMDTAAICIENKIWSAEQKKQIARYQKYLASLKGSLEKAIVFLTPDGRAPQSGTSGAQTVCIRPISYAQLADWLMSLQEALPPPLLPTIAMYAELCRQIRVVQPDGDIDG